MGHIVTVIETDKKTTRRPWRAPECQTTRLARIPPAWPVSCKTTRISRDALCEREEQRHVRGHSVWPYGGDYAAWDAFARSCLTRAARELGGICAQDDMLENLREEHAAIVGILRSIQGIQK